MRRIFDYCDLCIIPNPPCSVAVTIRTHMPDIELQPDKPTRSGLWGRLWGFIEGDYIDRRACDAAFARMHQRDAIGDKLHLFFALGGLVCLFGPVTMTEIALIPLIVFFVVRVLNTFPVWIHGFGQPTVLVALLLAAWMFIALIWSPDRPQGLREIAELRWIAAMGFFFPVIEHRRRLIAALCIGVLLGQTGQVLDAFDGFGIGWVAKLVENHPGRIAGWWHPVIAGGLLVAAMGLHLPAALVGKGRTRLLGVLGLCVSSVGVLATGTRGAWFAALLLLAVGAMLMLRFKRVPTRRVLLVGALGVLVLAIAAVLLRDSIMIRVNETRNELAAMQEGDYGSYSGRRVRMAQLAFDGFLEHPFVGVGTGGFEQWCAQQDQPYGAHAHNSTLHTLSTLGLIGALLWALVLLVALRCAWRRGMLDRSHPYAMGPLLGIVGLMLASITDSVHINAQTAAMLGVLLALSPAYLPGDDEIVQGAEKRVLDE